MRFCVLEIHGLGPKLVTGWLNAVDVVASSPQEAAAVATRGRLFGEVELDIPADGWSVRSCAGSLSVLHARAGGPEVMVVGPLFEPAACECLRQLRASILGWIPEEMTDKEVMNFKNSKHLTKEVMNFKNSKHLT